MLDWDKTQALSGFGNDHHAPIRKRYYALRLCTGEDRTLIDIRGSIAQQPVRHHATCFHPNSLVSALVRRCQ